ncbi:MAG: OmpA family protein, partial [Loktanella sp.]|nr:OmpA family protein [Loktanella sp.]
AAAADSTGASSAVSSGVCGWAAICSSIVVPDDAEVDVETVTEQTFRSATEDFANRVNADPAPVVAGSNQREGLSNFQRALLVGLGAAVVGTVLRNGDRVVSNSGDRVVVQRGDNFVVLKDDDVLLRQPGSQVETQTFADGSSRTIVLREDGSRIITIRGADGTVQRRARVLPDGTQVELFNDTAGSAPVVVSQLPPAPVFFVENDPARINVTTLRQALEARDRVEGLNRTFSLNQVRTIPEVRNLAPVVELNTLTFATGSAAIDPDQAAGLTDLGLAIAAIVENDPTQVFLIEGHTDATGPASLNLALSDRRAETVALALTQFFGVPPENLITQGYGEAFLKVPTLEAERANRRVAIRNITSLIRS